MRRTIFPSLFLLLFISSCSGIQLPLRRSTPAVTPSLVPKIVSPTPPFIASISSTVTLSPTYIQTTLLPTLTSTGTITSTLSQTLAAGLGLEILGCNTSLDITHGMGEVTNAFPLIRNQTGQDLTNLCATLSASDEARQHPDKTACIPILPTGKQVVLKLTVDTGYEQDTSIQVNVRSTQGVGVNASRSSCRELGLPGEVPAKVGVIEPIP